jgi:hypothetical protein
MNLAKLRYAKRKELADYLSTDASTVWRWDSCSADPSFKFITLLALKSGLSVSNVMKGIELRRLDYQAKKRERVA